GQGPGQGRGRLKGRSGAGRLGGLRRARPRLRGGGRGPGPGLLRRGAPGARGARLRALPGRPRRARARPVPVAGGGVRHGRLRGGGAPRATPPAGSEAGPPRTQAPAREELRTVSVLAAEVATEGPADPEELRDVTGRCLAAVIAEGEALGWRVASGSGGGVQAMFGAPEAHDDDPERAARAAFRALTAVAAIDGGTLR